MDVSKNSNLTKIQYNSLNYLRHNKQCVVLIADKTIPCVANMYGYIAAITRQKFNNANVYERKSR